MCTYKREFIRGKFITIQTRLSLIKSHMNTKKTKKTS